MSTVEDNVEQKDYSTTISSLPNEVLIGIFTLLPLKDRKIVRLVCTKWYSCCTCLSISKNEKFVFRTGISVQDIASVMVDSNLPSLNLEFQGLPISSLLAYTWKACGHKIETLEFYECQWNDKTIRNIITYCTKLKSFTMKSPIAATKHNLGNILCSPHLLDELARKGIRRTELHTFTMFVDDVHLPESILRKIFLIYPCIRHFSTGTYQDSFSYCLILHVGEQPKFSRLDKCLNSVNYAQFESLSFNLPTDGSWMEEIFIAKAPEQGFRLKHFKTMLIYKDSTKDTLLKFFSSQKNLIVVELGLAQCEQSFLKKIVFHILESCPNLREFHLKLIDPFCLYIESKEFPRFINLISKLEVLILNFNICPYNNPYAISLSEAFKSFTQKNFALKTLRLDETNDELSQIILQHCPLLEHLKLSLCTDETLQVIFKYLLKLQTLVLGDVDDCTDYGFTGYSGSSTVGYSIKQLQQLRHLDVSGFDAELSEMFVLELQLPHLEFLSLNLGIYPDISIDTLIRLASYVPELRVLCVDQVQGQALLEKTLQFCQHLNNLYHLICIETDYDILDYKTESFEAMFKECPSLRYISDAEYHILMFNPFTGKVLHKNLDSVKFQGSVFDDGLFC